MTHPPARPDDLWRRLGGAAVAGRPDFRRDPALSGPAPGGLLRRLSGGPPPQPDNLYRRLSGAVPDLDAQIAGLVTDPALRGLFDAGVAEAAELACELMALGEGTDAAVSDFSAAHYLALYPDLAGAGIGAFRHFLLHGLPEGRRYLGRLRADCHAGAARFDAGRPTCLICLHDLSATGAPRAGLALAREAAQSHNVALLAAAGGPLLDAAIACSVAVAITAQPVAEFAHLPHPAFRRVDFALLNSVESYLFTPPLVARGLPFATWLHEYPGTSAPGYKALFAALFPDLLAFSSGVLCDAWRPILDNIGFDPADSLILAQDVLAAGRVDRQAHAAARERIGALIGQDLGGPEGGRRRLVYGAGLAQWRKGTDLFAMTALIARDRDPDAVFVWIGAGGDPADAGFGVFLDRHLRRAGVGGADTNLFLLPEGAAYADLVRAADVLFLPSRLDPLPGVVFDAVREGAAAVLFEGATGFDDARHAGHPALHRVRFGDLPAAAAAILAAPRKAPAPAEAGSGGGGASVAAGPAADAVSGAAAANAADAAADAGSGGAAAGAVSGPAAAAADPAPQRPPVFAPLAAALRGRLAARVPAGPAADDYDVPVMFSPAPRDRDNRRAERAWLRARRRRFVWPSAGAARAEIAASENWVHERMALEPWQARPAGAAVPAFGIHLHAYYTEGLAEDLRRYRAWRHAARIVVTTDQHHKARRIAAIFEGAGLAPGAGVEIRVGPNRGRDVVPFLDLLRDSDDDPDALWCHLHHKKAPGTSVAGDVWRAFLMTVLLGDDRAMSDAVDRIARPGTGLVAAFDPYDTGWAGARKLLFGTGFKGEAGVLAALVARHLPGPLPPQPLLFPTGQMFWCRAGVARAMAGIFGADHPWPNEPAADDGTVLHAIERLWPALAASLGLDAVFLDKPDQRRV